MRYSPRHVPEQGRRKHGLELLMTLKPGDNLPDKEPRDTAWKHELNHEPPKREMPSWLRRTRTAAYAIGQAKASRPSTPAGRIAKRA